MWERIATLWDAENSRLLTACVSAIVLLLVVVWLRRRLRRAGRLPSAPDRSIDVAALDPSGPPACGPRLEVYGTPVRLACVVLAPVGREGRVPTPQELPEIVEQLVPGMKTIVASHQPILRLWPEQLSSQGFIHAFFNQVTLPGDRGKGTPWCSLAGKFRVGEQAYLVGLVVCAAQPNSLGQFEIQHEGKWNDVLRTKDRD